jgi:hypothetical protein
MACAVGHDPEERRRLAQALNGGQAGINEDEPAVAAAFCDLVLERAAQAVTRESVVAMASEFVQHPASGKHDFIEADVRQMISASLDGSKPPPLSPGQSFILRTLLAGFALLKMRADASIVNELVIAAEDRAFAAGFSPGLATHNP